MLNQTRRPRPPSRRSSAAHSQLRTPAAEAPSLPSKRYTPRSRAIPGAATAASLIGSSEDSPTKSKARPSSLLSDSSLPSPPPPYRGLPPVFAIPPPPQALESGPSSVRSSMMDQGDHEGDWVDDEPAQSTLTLHGLRRLLAEQDREEENGLDPLVAALGRLESASLRHNRSPAAAMPGMIDLGSSQTSPPISRRSTVRAFTAPTPKPRTVSHGELRQSLARAEAQANDDEARIAALEAALAEARESEDAQRKAAARLRRDLSTVKRQLQYAEDIAAEQKTLPQAPRFRITSRNSTPVLARKLQRRQKRMSADERLGWGAMSFPEFPSRHQESDTSVLSQDEVSHVLGETLDQLSEIESCKNERSLVMEVQDAETSRKTDAKSESSSSDSNNQDTFRGRPRLLPDPEPESAQEVEFKITSGEEASISSPGSTDDFSPIAAVGSGSPGKLVAERNRVRPALQASTFLTPAKSPRRPLTPARQVWGSSDYSSPVGGSTSSNRSARSAPRQFIRRQSPVKRGSARKLYEYSHQRSPSYASTNSTGAGRYGTISRLYHARNDSVRSIASDFLNLGEQRTLDAELGSSYNVSPAFDLPRMPDSSLHDESLLLNGSSAQPSPVRTDISASSRAHSTPGSSTPNVTARDTTMGSLFTPSGSMRVMSQQASPAKFVLAGKLAAPEDSDPYDTFSDGYARRVRLRWSRNLEEEISADKSSPTLIEANASLGAPWEGDVTEDESRLGVPVLDISSPPPEEATLAADFGGSVSVAGLATQDPWDEYSDRATPSPRGRTLRPLILCTRPEHARRSSLAMKRMSAAANGNSIAVAAAAKADSERDRALVRVRTGQIVRRGQADKAGDGTAQDSGPVTIPGRLVHDFFCWMLILLDYLEWAIILFYRLAVDIRAGPQKRRPRARRYYL